MLELLAQHQYLMAENRIMKAQQSNPCDRRKLSDAKVKIPSAQTLAPLRRECSIPAPLPPPILPVNLLIFLKNPAATFYLPPRLPPRLHWMALDLARRV